MDTQTTLPYTFSDALYRVRMNIMNYQDCFNESTEQFKQNEKLLRLIDAAPALLLELTFAREVIVDEYPKCDYEQYRIPQIDAALTIANGGEEP